MIAHRILRRCLLRTSNSLLFWLMLFGSAWLHTLRHIGNVCAREKERKPSQQKKVFYRIVRRVISCGKFSLLVVILFNTESRKVRRCLTASIGSLCEAFQETRCDWLEGKSNKDGRLGAKEGDCSGWKGNSNGRLIRNSQSGRFAAARVRFSTQTQSKRLIRTEQSLIGVSCAVHATFSQIFHFPKHKIDDWKLWSIFVWFPKFLKLQVVLSLLGFFMEFGTVKTARSLKFVCCQDVHGCVTVLLDGISIWRVSIWVTADQNRSPWNVSVEEIRKSMRVGCIGKCWAFREVMSLEVLFNSRSGTCWCFISDTCIETFQCWFEFEVKI